MRLRRVVPVLVVLAVVAACSGGSAGDAPTSTAAAPTTAPTTAAPTSTAPTTAASTAAPTTTVPPRPVPIGEQWTSTTLATGDGAGIPTDLRVVDGRLWLLTYPTGLWRSSDAKAWQRIDTAGLSAPAVSYRGVARNPSGRLLAFGNAGSDCTSSICTTSTGLVAVTDDDGATWQVAQPAAMRPPTRGTSVRLDDVVFHGGRFVALGTVKGRDWYARLWTSTDGISWTTVQDLRDPAGPVSGDQLLTDGTTLLVGLQAHPCSRVTFGTPGWILGASWVSRDRLLVGPEPEQLQGLHVVQPAVMAPPPEYDCSSSDPEGGKLTTIGTPEPARAWLTVAGRLTVLTQLPDDGNGTDDVGRSVAVATLDGATWSVTTGLAAPAPTDKPPATAPKWERSYPVDATGSPGFVLTGRFSPLDNAGPVQVVVQRPGARRSGAVSAQRLILPQPGSAPWWATDTREAAVGFDGAVVLATWIRISRSGRSEVHRLVVSVTRASTSAEVVTCRLVPGTSCLGYDLSKQTAAGALAGVDLSNAVLDAVEFGYKGSLERTVLRGASLVGAKGDDLDLRGADLRGADLRMARIGDIKGADLSGAKLQGATLRLTGAPASLAGAQLAGAWLRAEPNTTLSLAGIDLRCVSVSGPITGSRVLVVSDLTGAEVDVADDVCPAAEWRAVDLSKTTLGSVPLSAIRFDSFDTTSICPDGAPPAKNAAVLGKSSSLTCVR